MHPPFASVCMLAPCAYLWLPPLDSVTAQRVQPQEHCSNSRSSRTWQERHSAIQRLAAATCHKERVPAGWRGCSRSLGRHISQLTLPAAPELPGLGQPTSGEGVQQQMPGSARFWHGRQSFLRCPQNDLMHICCETGSFLGKVGGGTSERPPPRRELIVSYLLAVGVYSAHTLMPPHVVSYLRTMCLQEGCCMLTRLLCVYVSTVRPPVTSCILYRASRAS